MFNSRMDLAIKTAVLPFTEYGFCNEDNFIELVTSWADDKEHMGQIYSILHKTQRVNNLDEINLLIKNFYNRDELLGAYNRGKNESYYYFCYIIEMAKTFVSHRDGKFILKFWEDKNEAGFLGPYTGISKIALWNSLNRTFTTDILVPAYLLKNKIYEEKYLNGFYSQVSLEDLQLQQILQRGVAENHLHAGAGINFYIKWQDLMNLTNSKTEWKEKEKYFKDVVIDKKLDLFTYVNAAAFVRLIMADFLQCEESRINQESKNNFYKSYIKKYKKQLNGDDGYSGEYPPKGNLNTDPCRELYSKYEFIHDIMCCIYRGGEISKGVYNFRNLFEDIKGLFNIREDMPSKSLRRDILEAGLFREYKDLNTTMENIFLFKCLKYMESHKNDEFFGKVFWQYIRIKNETFQCMVQGNQIKGLDNFQSYYDRSTDMDYSSKKEYWEIVIGNQIQNKCLKKLEFRVAPKRGMSREKMRRELKLDLIDFFEVYRKLLNESKKGVAGDRYANIPAIGLVFHFLKKKDKSPLEKCWYDFDGKNSEVLYFKSIQNEYKMQAEVICGLRESIPALSEYIVGIDAASLENSTEPWVFASVFKNARYERKRDIINEKTEGRIKNLGFTFHVGEDFRHILTGIRRIDETIEHFNFLAGDRIGHGIALGVDVDRWIESNKVVVMTRLEYLENLLWVWSLYKDGKYNRGFDMEHIEKEIMKQAEEIYMRMEGINIYNLWKAYSRKFEEFGTDEEMAVNQRLKSNRDDDKRSRLLFCSRVDSDEARFWNEEKLVRAQHCSCYLKRMLEPIQILVKKDEGEMLKQVQRLVAEKIAARGIVIETNPTSNRAIGQVENIFEHYSYNLNRKGLDGESGIQNTLLLTINTDDPSVFNTTITSEFAYIFYSLIEKGYPREDVLLWIDKIRNYGMISSFIDDRGLTTEQRLDEIDGILRALKE